jgi:rubrerythrin
MSYGKHTPEDFKEEMKDLELGIKKEQGCRDFYLQSAEQVADARVKALYGWFANAAAARLAALEAVRVSAAESQTWVAGMDEQLKAADVTISPALAFDPAAGGKPGKAEVMTLRQAIELEKEAASIYFTAAQRSREPNIRTFYRYLAPIEESHKQLLESYFDGLMKQAVKK